jgi:D-lactate dehydrogenase
MLDVFFYEAFAEEAESLRRCLPPAIEAGYTDLAVQESGHATPPARLISIRTQSRIPLEWQSAIDGVLSRSTGFDHLAAYAAAATRPLAYGNLPLYCHRAVAEHAMLLWMALLRKLPRQMRQFREFHRDGLTGAECQGRTLVVVGVGNIGHEICVIGRALGMNVLGVDLEPRHADVAYGSIEDALPAADVLVCAMDYNATNHGYFDAEKWRRVKPGVVFVNISRGELSPSTALLAALKAGQLAGVGLDVYDHEAELAVALRTGAAQKSGATPSEDPEARAALELAQRDDAICTPHNAFNSFEAVERKSMHSVQQVVAFLETGSFLWPAIVGR